MRWRTRKPNRLKYYYYSNYGWYYVTICAGNHIHYFGKIEKETMILNKNGKIAESAWHKIPVLHKNIETDYHVIMPNHIHGIIIINVGEANLASPTDRTKMLLSKIIQQYKRAVTLEIRKHNPNFKWQRSFYERIIRNEKELYNIRKYIEQNPLKWYYEKKLENLEIQK